MSVDMFTCAPSEMSASLQVKLLRALETRRIRPLGSASEIAVDVRVVAAFGISLERFRGAGPSSR